METIKTWKDIDTFDDIISPKEKEILSELEIKTECPCLRIEGKFFYYCGFNLPIIRHKEPSPFNPIYQTHVSLAELQLHCIDDFKRCCFYSGKLKK